MYTSSKNDFLDYFKKQNENEYNYSWYYKLDDLGLLTQEIINLSNPEYTLCFENCIFDKDYFKDIVFKDNGISISNSEFKGELTLNILNGKLTIS